MKRSWVKLGRSASTATLKDALFSRRRTVHTVPLVPLGKGKVVPKTEVPLGKGKVYPRVLQGYCWCRPRKIPCDCK